MVSIFTLHAQLQRAKKKKLLSSKDMLHASRARKLCKVLAPKQDPFAVAAAQALKVKQQNAAAPDAAAAADTNATVLSQRRGLQNLGANCYLNAVAQCFWALTWQPNTPFFTELRCDAGCDRLVYATQYIRSKLGCGAQNVGECVEAMLDGAAGDDIYLQLRLTDICTVCGHQSSHVTTLPALQLSMAPTFATAITHTFGEEQMQARCEGAMCQNTITTRTRTTSRERLPNHLLLVELKREAHQVADRVQGVPAKLFGTYYLRAAALNTGGHYVAVVWSEDGWLLIDDMRVMNITDVESVLERATLLFYEQTN